MDRLPLQFLMLVFAGWVNRLQQEMIEYLQGLWVGLLSAPTAAVFSVVGLAQGFVVVAMMPLQSARIGELFGRQAFSQASGLFSGAVLLLTLVATPLFGLLLDRSGGDFPFAFGCFLVNFDIAGVMLAWLHLRPEGVASLGARTLFDVRTHIDRNRAH